MFICHPTTLMNSELLQKIKPPVGPWIPEPRALLRLTGEDRVRFLNGQVTQDLKKLQPGQAVRAAIITSKGRLEADTRIAATSEALLLETDTSLRESIRIRLEKFIVADDVAIEDLSESFYLAHFSGLNQPPGGCPAESFSFQCARFREPGADLWIPTSSNWATASSSAKDWEPLRIARGLPLWNIDVGPDTLPPEAGFESDAISSTKGCYIGQEVISRIRSVGHVNRHLCVLASRLPPSTYPNISIPASCNSENGQSVGSLTSFATVDGLVIALAMIKRDHARTGNSVLAGGVVWTILRHA
jgi:folate-binding protein YgfZ